MWRYLFFNIYPLNSSDFIHLNQGCAISQNKRNKQCSFLLRPITLANVWIFVQNISWFIGSDKAKDFIMGNTAKIANELQKRNYIRNHKHTQSSKNNYQRCSLLLHYLLDEILGWGRFVFFTCIPLVSIILRTYNASQQLAYLCVLGASSGIGAATALQFARQGIRLAIHGRNEERLGITKQKCIEAGLKDGDVSKTHKEKNKQGQKNV